MPDKLLDIPGWRPRFYLPKQMPVLVANGSQPPFLIDCTTTVLKSDNATEVSDCRPLVQDYFSENRLVWSLPQKHPCSQYCGLFDQYLIPRQPLQFQFGIRSGHPRIRACPGSHV